jgi:peptidyl-prolyl cis-trans isomerase SurA
MSHAALRRILAAVLNKVGAMRTIASMVFSEVTRSRLRRFCGTAAAALFILALPGAARPAAAQVVALVNGAPITEIDITQRIKLIQVTSHKAASRQEALKALVDEHLKIFITKRYGIEPSAQDIESAFANMAERSRLSARQMEEQMSRQGLSPTAFKNKLKADIGWSGLIRGKFASSLQISDIDIRSSLGAQNEPEKDAAAAKIYTLYPITFVAPNGSQEGARRNEAENLRSRFASCTEGLKLARALHGVVVRDAIKRGSSDLAPQLREILDKMEIGRLTAPEVTPQGVQMFALCERQDGDSNTGNKRAAREDLFSKRFEAESKKFLEEVRRQSMIEYR